jgi:hypothetical protein
MKLCPECEKENPGQGVRVCADCFRKIMRQSKLKRSRDYEYIIQRRTIRDA